jgi:hypothetical protein
MLKSGVVHECDKLSPLAGWMGWKRQVCALDLQMTKLPPDGQKGRSWEKQKDSFLRTYL